MIRRLDIDIEKKAGLELMENLCQYLNGDFHVFHFIDDSYLVEAYVKGTIGRVHIHNGFSISGDKITKMSRDHYEKVKKILDGSLSSEYKKNKSEIKERYAPKTFYFSLSIPSIKRTALIFTNSAKYKVLSLFQVLTSKR